jgi:hypothetical protein
MSMRIDFAALAAILTVLATRGAASAQSFDYSYASPGYQSAQKMNRSKVKVPANVYGSAGGRPGLSFHQSPDDVVVGGKMVGRDPDPRVRFEILRDGQFAGQN